jgi:hypothetical protein
MFRSEYSLEIINQSWGTVYNSNAWGNSVNPPVSLNPCATMDDIRQTLSFGPLSSIGETTFPAVDYAYEPVVSLSSGDSYVSAFCINRYTSSPKEFPSLSGLVAMYLAYEILPFLNASGFIEFFGSPFERIPLFVETNLQLAYAQRAVTEPTAKVNNTQQKAMSFVVGGGYDYVRDLEKRFDALLLTR